MNKIFFLIFVCCQLIAKAQQVFPVTDQTPVLYEGLKAGYTITDASEKEVGNNNKETFSRYKIKFYVINSGTEAKLFIQKPGLFSGGSASNKLVEFKCANATGARLTNKEATLQMQPCKIEAAVDDKQCGSDKTVQNRRIVDIGYWIKPGETIVANTIMIVPLNEKPDMKVTFYPYNNGMVGNTNFSNGGSNNYGNNSYTQGFVRIKNFAGNTYLHNQDGPVACSKIDFEWWSAQWEILPVNGTSYFQIRNRWKNNFISTENSSMISDNGQSANAMWQIEETGNNNICFFRNAAANSRLTYINGRLQMTTVNNTNTNSQWIIEK